MWGGIPGSILAGVSGNCSYDDMDVNYDVYLSDYWYVGWLNLNYKGNVPYDQWPVRCKLGSYFDLEFSGTSSTFNLNGSFGSTRRGSGGEEVDLCTGSYGYVIGTSTGLGDASYASPEQWRNGCVMDTSGVCSPDSYAFGAVYVPSSTPFANMGCCKVTSSSDATGTGCKCFYGYANKAYSYSYRIGSGNTTDTTKTKPFKDVYIDYRYGGCKNGHYAVGDYADGTQFVRGLMNDKTLTAGTGPCPDQDNSYLATTIKDQSGYFTNFWKNCASCEPMTYIVNDSSFSPTITSYGTMSLVTSDSGTGGSTCKATVKGAKNATGTFDIVGSCLYDG